MTAACSASASAGHTDYRNGSLPLHSQRLNEFPPEAVQSLLCRHNNNCHIIGGSCHNYDFCRDLSFVVTKVLSQQTHVCRDKTHLSSQQKYAGHNKRQIFVATNTILS